MTNKKSDQKNLWQDVPDTVYHISQLNFVGNIIPHTWWNHIKHPPDINGVEKPNANAIVILADICYWYRATIVRDESSGKIIGYKKKFKGERLQKSYSGIAKQFGFTRKQARDAVNFLEQKGLIKKFVEDIIETDSGEILSNVLYLEPIVEKISEITFDKQEKEIINLQIDKVDPNLEIEGGVTYRSQGGMTYRSQGVTSKSEGCDLEVGRVCPTGHTYTKITTEINNNSSNNESDILTEKTQFKEHVMAVKKWFEENQAIFRDDLIPLWKKLYPKIADVMEKIVAECYSNLLTHQSNYKNYSAYFQKWVFNAACGKYERSKDYDPRYDESLQWYILHHPYGYCFNSEEDERGYIAQVFSTYIDQYSDKKKRYSEVIQKIFSEYWKLDSSVHPKFEYLEKSNWRLRYLPDALNYIIALNKDKTKKARVKDLVDLTPQNPGRYYAQDEKNGKEIFEIDVYRDEDGKLMTDKGTVDQLKNWKWSFKPI